MNVASTVVAAVAAGGLALGSVGMASAGSSDDHAHAVHGSIGENPNLALNGAKGGRPKLVGIVNDNRELEITDRTPSPGRYKIVVRDSSTAHNWHLYGNGKSISTTVRGTGRWVFRIRLTAGSYRVVCDPHNDAMEFPLTVS